MIAELACKLTLVILLCKANGFILLIPVGIFVAVVSFSPRLKKYQWMAQQVVAGDFIFWLLTIMLAALLCVKVVQLIDARGRSLFQRLDILRDRVSDSPGYNRLRRLSDGKSISWWRYPIHALFGRKIWEKKLPCVLHVIPRIMS